MAEKIIDNVIFDEKNFNTGTELGKELINKSISKFGYREASVLDKHGNIIGGNKRTQSALDNGITDIEIIKAEKGKVYALQFDDIELDSPEGRELALALNATAKENINFDEAIIFENISDDIALEWGFDIVNFDADLVKEQKLIHVQLKLKDRFIVPPFSILDTRQGYWMERKAMWKLLINDKGESRENTLHNSESSDKDVMNAMGSVSILDPVLAEIINLWFGLPSGNVFDCFAGDTVFGYVSSHLKNTFTGIELRQEQADLNNERVKGLNAKYICDDGRNVLNHVAENSQDLLFSCPPYFDLEVYSNLPNDASNQKEYKDFLNILDTAFSNAIKSLKDNRFAVITVGDVRDKDGFYYRFVDDIKDIFKRNGVRLYNEMILVESIGTLPQRASRFMGNRKVGKCHQNVLVFFKGDPKQIKIIYPILENLEHEGTDS